MRGRSARRAQSSSRPAAQRKRRQSVPEELLNSLTSQDLSACAALCEKRLRERGPLLPRDIVERLAAGIERSLRSPRDPAASFLLIGPPGSGKLAFARAAIQHVHSRVTEGAPKFIEVRLHGLLHAGGSLGVLRALAHALDGLDGHGSKLQPDSMSQQLCNVIVERGVQRLKEEDIGLLFLVSDFEAFAQSGSVHSVLYRVFNLLQDITLRGVFLGLTSHQDAVDGLEKRVKSRFLPVEIAVPGLGNQKPGEVLDILQDIATVPFVGGDATLTDSQPGDDRFIVGVDKIFDFNALLEKFLSSSEVQSAVTRYLASDGDFERLSSALLDALYAGADVECPKLSGACKPSSFDKWAIMLETFKVSLGVAFTNVPNMLSGLSRLELALLLALRNVQQARGNQNSDTEAVVFRDVYEEYATIRTGGRKGFVSNTEGTEKIAERSTTEKAWGRLIEAALVIESGQGPANARAVFLAIPEPELTIALEGHENLGAFLERWGKGRVE